MAIAYGSQVIEKRFILSRGNKGIDYESSLDPENFVEFCKLIRDCEKAIGKKVIRDFTVGELNYRAVSKKSIVAKSEIFKGEKITRDKVMFVRSEPGILPDKFINIKDKIAKRDIQKYNNLSKDDF